MSLAAETNQDRVTKFAKIDGDGGRNVVSISLSTKDKRKLNSIAAKLSLRTGQRVTASSVVRMMISEYNVQE